MVTGNVGLSANRSRLLNLTSRLEAMAEMLLMPNGVQALRSQRPLSVSAFALTSRLAKLGVRPNTLLDVGANEGQFTSAALLHWPGLEVHAFEPLPDEADKLEVLGSTAPGMHVHRSAAGEADGTAVLHRHAHSLSSSLLRSSPSALRAYSWAKETLDLEVPVVRLDTALDADALRPPVLLKIDVQGYESQVLAGTTGLLSSLAAIVMEQAFETFYEGQRPFPQTHAMLLDAGWELSRILATRSEDGIPVEADCLYLPSKSAPGVPEAP